MNDITANFHLKNADSGYFDQYVVDHMPRVKWVIERFGLDKIENQRVVEVGVGRGLFFSQMSPTNYYVGLDGAIIPPDKKLCPFLSLRADFNREDFGMLFDNEEKFDVLICSETIEHVAGIDNIMLQMKKLLKPNGMAIFTIPDVSVTHPVAFVGLFYPWQNFVTYIQQYAWIVEEHDVYQSGWKTQCFKVRNAPMIEQIPVFPKDESKFWGQNPIDWTNL